MMSLPQIRSALEVTPPVLSTLMLRLDPDLLQVNEGEGTWSPFQVVCHLAWGEVDDWIPRVRTLMERGTNEAFTPFDRVAGFSKYGDWPLPRLLDEFARLRSENLNALDALGLTAQDLSRQGLHPQLGIVTLEQLLSTWVTHDFAHLTQISRVLTRHHGAAVGPWRAFFSALQS